MKAVNLIPPEERRAGGGAFADLGGPTRGLLAVLVLALVVAIAYVTLANGVASKREDLARIEQRAVAAERQAAALKPYGDVAALRERSLATVRSLASARFDWSALLSDVSRRVPTGVTLMSLNGAAVGAVPPGSAAPAPGSGQPAASGPTVQLAGCTGDHSAVARVMERMRAVEGVVGVQLASSNRTGEQSGGGGSNNSGCPRRDQFQMTLSLAAAATPPAPPAQPEAAR